MNIWQKYCNLAKTMLSKIIDLATSLPTVVLIIITLFMSTYFIAKDFDKIENGFLSIFTDDTKIKVRRVKSEIMHSIIRVRKGIYDSYEYNIFSYMDKFFYVQSSLWITIRYNRSLTRSNTFLRYSCNFCSSYSLLFYY